jgi:ABC-type transport system substrate-binding protein
MVARLIRTLLPVPLLALAACGGDADRPVEVAVIGDPGSPFSSGPRLPVAAQLVRSATAEGLVAFDDQGRVIPALADRWIVTDDGLSYIFRLRDGRWADGTPITADNARTALNEAIARVRATALGLDLAPIDDVRTMAGRVIEIRLKRQAPDFLQLLAQPELGLLRRGKGAGPMRLTRQKQSAFLVAIPPEDRGLPQQSDWDGRMRKLRLVALPAAEAITRFNAGDADMVLGGRFEDFPRLDAAGVSRGAIRLVPVAGLFGLSIVGTQGFLSLPENREALSMAIDRDAIGNALGVGGWTATTRLVNPGLADDNGTVGERWPGRSMAERQVQARARVARWERPVQLRVALPAGPGADQLFARLEADWDAIGIKVLRVAEGSNADLVMVDTVARYPRADWFLNQLSCIAARGLCDSAADRLAGQARVEPDATKRAELRAEAEAKLTIANGYIPLGVPIRWSLVSGRSSGLSPNPWSIHPLMPMAMRTR